MTDIHTQSKSVRQTGIRIDSPIVIQAYIETCGQADKRTVHQSDRHTDKNICIHAYREEHRQPETVMQTYSITVRHTNEQTDR